jgi:vacuolar-type H+-ATPase subunit I/STV1
MLRVTWFVPEERLGKAINALAATGVFHLQDHRWVGTPADLTVLCQAWSERQHLERHAKAQRLRARLPNDTFLDYQFGWLPHEQRPLFREAHGVFIDEDGLFLWAAAGATPPALAPYLFTSTPTEIPVLPRGLPGNGWELACALRGRLGQAGTWVVIDGWISAGDRPHFECLLASEIAFFTPAEESGLDMAEVPVRIERPAWLQGFVALMRTYGMTGYREIDPTAFFAFGFVLMFGLMFADLGQGLLLALLGAWLQRGEMRRLPNARTVGTVLLPIGLSAALFGALFGSFFAREDVIPPLWFHPMDAALFYLVGSIGLGVCLLVFGLLLNLVNALRMGNWREALHDTYGPIGLVYYIGFIGVLIALGLRKPFWASLSLTVATAALVTFVGMAYRECRGQERVVRILLPLLEGYDMVSKFLVQTLSFARVAAFTLAHVGLSHALMMVYSMFEPWPLVAFPVLVIGNLGIIALEGALVSIQVLRLNFFEFFTKFVRAQGKPFTPLTLKGGLYAQVSV